MIKKGTKSELFSHYSSGTLKKFKEFHAENPHVYTEFKNLAVQMRNAGQTSYSAQAIIYTMRWNHDLRTTGKPFKISNDFTSIYARLLCYDNPAFLGFFKMHKQGKSVVSGTLPKYENFDALYDTKCEIDDKFTSKTKSI